MAPRLRQVLPRQHKALAARQRRGVGFPHGRADEERGGAEPRLFVLGGDGAERARLGGEQRAARREAVGLARHSDAEAHLARARARVRVRVRVRVKVKVQVKGRVRVRVRLGLRRTSPWVRR